ncbi:MAG: flagellar motor switch protein FliN [Polyangiaceae bacterium]
MSVAPPDPSEAKEPPVATPAPLLDLGALRVLRDVEVEITVEIGRCRKRIAEVLRMRPGQTLEIPKSAGEPVDIYVNDQLLGHGEAVVVGDRYGVRITQLRDVGSDRT